MQALIGKMIDLRLVFTRHLYYQHNGISIDWLWVCGRQSEAKQRAITLPPLIYIYISLSLCNLTGTV